MTASAHGRSPQQPCRARRWQRPCCSVAGGCRLQRRRADGVDVVPAGRVDRASARRATSRVRGRSQAAWSTSSGGHGRRAIVALVQDPSAAAAGRVVGGQRPRRRGRQRDRIHRALRRARLSASTSCSSTAPAKHAWLPRHPSRGCASISIRSVRSTALLPLALSCRWRVGVRVHAPDERDARDPRFGGPVRHDRERSRRGARAPAASRRRRRRASTSISASGRSSSRRVRPRPSSTSLGSARRRRSVRASSTAAAACPGRRRTPAALADLRRRIALARAQFRPELEQVWLENGRFITEQSAVLAVRVLDVKDRPEGRYLICDGGRTNHALAADNGPHPLAGCSLTRTGRGRA